MSKRVLDTTVRPDGVISVDPGVYTGLPYDTRSRWSSYWHQISEALALAPESVLEVGVGSRVVGRYLRSLGITTVGVDVDPRLQPERVGDVRALPCADGEFDVVLCCQVLEHLPFPDFPRALAELRRVARRRVVLSLPVSGRSFQLLVRIPPFRALSFARTLPSRHRFEFDGQHYWQLGARNTTGRQVRAHIRQHFRIVHEFQPLENPYHRFFLLEPSEQTGPQ